MVEIRHLMIYYLFFLSLCYSLFNTIQNENKSPFDILWQDIPHCPTFIFFFFQADTREFEYFDFYFTILLFFHKSVF